MTSRRPIRFDAEDLAVTRRMSAQKSADIGCYGGESPLFGPRVMSGPTIPTQTGHLDGLPALECARGGHAIFEPLHPRGSAGVYCDDAEHISLLGRLRALSG